MNMNRLRQLLRPFQKNISVAIALVLSQIILIAFLAALYTSSKYLKEHFDSSTSFILKTLLVAYSVSAAIMIIYAIHSLFMKKKTPSSTNLDSNNEKEGK